MGDVVSRPGSGTESADDPTDATDASSHARVGPPRAAHQAGGLLLAAGALGVVFGDIGTSPLYALQAVFAPSTAVKPTAPASTASSRSSSGRSR